MRNRESFMLIHPVVYQKTNGSLFLLMNIFMLDFSIIKDAMDVIFIYGMLPVIMSLTTGCMKWKLELLPRKVFYMTNHSITRLPKEFMIWFWKKCENSKNRIRFAVIIRETFLQKTVLILKVSEMGFHWMIFSKMLCAKDWIIMSSTTAVICRQVW